MNGLAGILLATAFVCNGGWRLIELDMIGLGLHRGVRVEQLRCEYLADPLGIDVLAPRLSWIIKSDARGQKQSAYQILVAGSEEKLKAGQGDLWDTGKVVSDQSTHVVYGGRPLWSRMRCWWKVRVWDKDGKPGSFSQAAFWEIGLLDRDDWKGKWLSAPAPKDNLVQPSPFFRKTFSLSRRVKNARLYISGLGYYELYVNGKKVGDRVLDPAFTRYDRRVLYVTYDVTSELKSGKNAMGVVLGNGWYNMHTRCVWDFYKAPWRDRPTMLCQLEVEFGDGSTMVVASDSTWQVCTGPILFESIRNGETYDARLEKPGWSAADYDDRDWAAAQVVAGPKGKLVAQMLPPIKVNKTVKPVNLTEPKDGVYVFDMGQNMAGWAQLKVSGPAGTRVVMRYGERLNADGTLDQKEIAAHIKEGAFQTDTYILKGKGTEIWEPGFAYHGFQYVEVTGLPDKPTLDTLHGRVVHTSFGRAGSFECSNELFNKIQQNTLWSYVSNFHGYPTDCPHREKNGWTGDAHLAAETGLYNFAPEAAYTKWMNDFFDEQRDSGELPGIVPTSGWGYQWGNGPAWDSAYLIIPWYMYRYCGDTRILATHYDRFKRYVDYLTSRASDGIVSIGLGDWVPAKTQTPEAVTSTAFYYVDAVITGLTARLLGKEDEAEEYFTLARQIRDAFNKAFYKGDGIYANGSQTALSFALYADLVPQSERQKTLDRLVENIEKNKYNIDTGILGAKCILTALSENGRHDVAFGMATQTTYPSYGHWIERGATTLWEQWDGGASRNHIMFGDISAWFYKQLAGINVDPAPLTNTGFKHIIIRPRPAGDLTWVRAEHNCPYGLIKTYWHRKADKFTLEVTIPANTTATIYVPTSDAESVREGGKLASNVSDVQFIGIEGNCAAFAVGAGKYRFVSTLVQ